MSKQVPLALLCSTFLLASCGIGSGKGGNVVDGRYVVCGVVLTPTGVDGYAAVVPSLDEGVEISLPDSLPTGDRGTCVTTDDALFVISGESPLITKYSVSDTGVFEELGQVSFAGEGITKLRQIVDIVSDTKAYIYDRETLQLVIWNPSDMTVTEAITIPELETESADDWMNAYMGHRNGETVLVVGYANDNGPHADLRVVFIDPETDNLDVITTESCGGISFLTGVVVEDDGTVYVASNALTSASHMQGASGSFEPCMVRILPTEHQFDDSFFVEMNDITDADATADLIDGPGETAYVLGYDADESNLGDDAAPADIIGAAAWKLYRLNRLDDGEGLRGEEVDGFPASPGGLPSYVVDGRTYFGNIGFLYSSTTLFDVTDGSTVTGMNAPGAVLSIHALPQGASN